MTPVVIDPTNPAGLSYEELLTEFYARGFDYLNDSTEGQTRASRWINEAYLELCSEEAWPFLENTSTSTPPITFTDLGQILSVVDSSDNSKLIYLDRRTLTDFDPTIATTGTPQRWYFEDQTLNVYPVSTSITLDVRYIRSPTLLSSTTDVPIVPGRWHYMIIDLAVIKGFKDSDKYDAVAALRAEYERGLNNMRDQLLYRNYGDAEVIVSTYGHVDS